MIFLNHFVRRISSLDFKFLGAASGPGGTTRTSGQVASFGDASRITLLLLLLRIPWWCYPRLGLVAHRHPQLAPASATSRWATNRKALKTASSRLPGSSQPARLQLPQLNVLPVSPLRRQVLIIRSDWLADDHGRHLAWLTPDKVPNARGNLVMYSRRSASCAFFIVNLLMRPTFKKMSFDVPTSIFIEAAVDVCWPPRLARSGLLQCSCAR